MTYTIYVLRDTSGKMYKGVTKDLKRRLAEHKRGQTISTRKMSGLEVIYTELVDEWVMARKRELYLKSAAGRKFLKKILSR